MNVVAQGAVITVKNSYSRIKRALLWILKHAGTLLLKIPLQSLSFLSRIGNYLLDGKNRKIAIIILVTVGAIIFCRTLITKANRRRLMKETKSLFPRFNSRFTSRLNLTDADDEELLKTAWDLEQFIKAKNITLDPHSKSQAFARGLKIIDNRSENPRMVRDDKFTEFGSTHSGHSLEFDVKRLSMATKALSNRPSVY